LTIYSEGAISYTEAWQLNPTERGILIKTLNKYNKAKSGKQSEEWMGDD